MNTQSIVSLISEGFEKAKQGDALNIYRFTSEFFRAGSMPLKSHYPFGWIVYYALHQSADADIAGRKQLLATYLQLQLSKPHKLHSMILTEAIRLYKDAQAAGFGKRRDQRVDFSILKFVNLWELTNLRPGDWNRKHLAEKTLSSTVEKLITVICDECVSQSVLPPESFVAIVDQAVEHFQDSHSLLAQRSSLCELLGQTDRAKELLIKAVLLAPGKFFLWSKLAELTDINAEPNMRVALLQRALKSPGPEQFKGKVRLMLAKTFFSLNAYPQALWELQQVRRIYESNNWHLSTEFQSLASHIPDGTVATNPEEIYRKVSHLADEMIYASIPSIVMTKTYHKMPKEGESSRFGPPAPAWRLTDDTGSNVWITPHKLGLNPELPVGTRVSVKLHLGKVVKASLV